MKSRPTLLQKLWRKLRPAKAPQPAPKRTSEPPRKPSSSLEPLEGRIAPAALLSPTTLIYKDLDGDIVTVKFTKAPIAELTSDLNVAKANDIFKFSTGNVVGGAFDAANAPFQQLQLIDLTKASKKGSVNVANGTGVTVTVVKGSVNGTPGNGDANIGYLNATGLPLGAVSIPGDLGRIDAGFSTSPTGVASLKVKSIGVADIAVTQIAGGANLQSNIVGALGSLTVSKDVKDAVIRVKNVVDFFGNISAAGKIGAITVSGSLSGTAAVSSTSNNTGLIQADGDIGAVKIGTGIFGGGGTNAGSVRAGGKIASVTISGDVKGAQGQDSGAVVAGGTIGAVTIKGDLLAGSGNGSGMISSGGTMGAVKISGDVDGTASGSAVGAGGVKAGGNITSVNLTGALKGGANLQTGFIESGADLGALTLHDIIGGAGINSGTVTAAGKIAAVTVLGNIMGGTAAGAGSVFSGLDSLLVGDIGAVKITGMIQGGSQDNAGTISSGGKIASVTLGPFTAPPAPPAPFTDVVRVMGGGGANSGSFLSVGAMGPVKVNGHVQGGGGSFSGAFVSHDFITPEVERAGDMGAVLILGRLQGGGGGDSGQVHADGKLASASVGQLSGAGGARSGSLRAGQGVVNPGITGAISVKGTLSTLPSGAGPQSGGIFSEGKLTSVTVAGAVTGGSIGAGNDIGALTFKSSVQGLTVSARGQAVQGPAADLAIGKISVNGNVAASKFLAGYDTSLLASNPDAQIGTVLVKGTWTASDLVAGVRDAGAAGFGKGDTFISGPDNANIVSQIASVVINGAVAGTVSPTTDNFGFTAQRILAFKAGGVSQPLKAAEQDPSVNVGGATNDVFLTEIATPAAV